MSDIVTTDPVQHAELLAQIEAMKETFSSLRKAEQDRPKKGKVREDLNELNKSDFPLIQLSRVKYTNKKGDVNVASMRSQFKAMAKDMNLSFEPSVVEFDGEVFLVNFDENDAERKFNEYILRHAGVDESDIRSITTELDKATK